MSLADMLRQRATAANTAGNAIKAQTEYQLLLKAATAIADKGEFVMKVDGVLTETKTLLTDAGFAVTTDPDYGDPNFLIVSWA